MMWLAMKIFGGGFGMAAPTSQQKFYWLLDKSGKGRFYSFSAGFGAQLTSFEWRRPDPGTRRTLGEETFEVFGASRGRWPIMYRLSWRAISLGHDASAEEVRSIEARLLR